MAGLLFITHPQVLIEPEQPIASWSLSALGAARMRVFAHSQAASAVARIISSPETKGMQTARILADARGVDVATDPRLAELDRNATGYLPLPEFEHTVAQGYLQPQQSVRGWEPFAAAQARVLDAYRDIAQTHRNAAGDTALIAHGGVGTLLLCALRGAAISRDFEPPFLGHYWRANRHDAIEHGWRSLDADAPVPGPDLHG